jgi:hypothetical protein
MSLKTSTFRRIIGRPLNTHNFVVRIPALADVQILVSSTTFPTETLGEKKLYYQGEPINFPTYPLRGGEWTCSLNESEYAKVYMSASLEFNMNFLQALGTLTTLAAKDRFDIIVGIRPLSNSNSILGAISDLGLGTGVFSVTLQGCFLKGMSPVNLSSSAATTNWVWNLTFSYDSIVYEHAVPNFNRHDYKDLPPLPDIKNIDLGENELSKQGGQVSDIGKLRSKNFGKDLR